MLSVIFWFIGILLIVPVLYLIENFFRSMMPGHNQSYFLQPVYQLAKLFSKKERNKPTRTQWLSMGSCFFALVTLLLTVLDQSLLLIYLGFMLMELFTLLGAGSSKEAFGTMSAQRGISRFIVSAFTYMIAFATIYRVAGVPDLAGILSWPAKNQILLYLPLTWLSLLVVLMLRGSVLYFDFGITGKHLTLLDTALYTSYSGWSLATAWITQWIEIGIWIKLLSVFLPWKSWISFTVMAVLYLIALLADNFIPRTDWKKAARNAWIWAGGMAVMNYIWLFVF